MKKIVILLVSVLSFFINIESSKALYDGYEYYIENYKVTIDVNKDNTFDIEEEILVYFNVASHGIYRTIPKYNTVYRLDGTTSNNAALLTDFTANVTYVVDVEDGNYLARLGDSDIYVSEYQTYVINYTYNIGKDLLDDMDEFYYNIIGSEWDTIIEQVEFVINMPEEFDQSLLGFSSGSAGSTTNNVYYEVDGNTITGRTYSALYSGEALTIRLELPEGYFSDAKSIYDSYITYSFVLPLGCLLLALAIVYFKNLNKKVIDPVEFYPPEDFNSVEVAYFYKGSVTNNDIVSLLVYLADKKYLKIVEEKSKGLLSKADFKIIKIKDYDGEKEEERKFMEGLFRKGDEVTLSSLKYSFYRTLNLIRRDINTKENKRKLVAKNNSWYKFLLILLAAIAILGTLILQIINFASVTTIIYVCILMLIYVPLFALIITLMQRSLVFGIIMLFFITIHAIGMCSPIIEVYTVGTLPIINILIGFVVAIIIAIMAQKFVVRTEFGLEIYGRIKGFRHFLLTAEKEQLEQLVNKNPSYFYDILPFTYVLGVSKKWIKKFESISLEPADWYTGTTSFNVNTFNESMVRIMNSSSSSPSSGGSGGSSGGSSGGGSSGGGSGGGGGGRW